jgi:hypothetical protein
MQFAYFLSLLVVDFRFKDRVFLKEGDAEVIRLHFKYPPPTALHYLIWSGIHFMYTVD